MNKNKIPLCLYIIKGIFILIDIQSTLSCKIYILDYLNFTSKRVLLFSLYKLYKIFIGFI
ncbi:hypothetical protein C1142_13495 [Clostridium botulinum]|nr:hypothetical protein DZC34_02395 [Clostridium botulinum]RUT57081.1 hypothetical protein C1142_13495 [Clostridium botulinum]RUT57256.1 hypothetical protein C1144_18000 [Clostridium botulinum]RUT60201.1 hypothetical protein C1143_17790 [Clostridium botulinum]